jgi:hypothetical protein
MQYNRALERSREIDFWNNDNLRFFNKTRLPHISNDSD